MKFIPETVSICFKGSPRANLRPSSPLAQSHHGQGHNERAIIELVTLDFEFLLFFWSGKGRETQTDMREEKGRKKKGKNIICRRLWLRC